MSSWLPGLARKPLRRVLALFGALGVLGTAGPAAAAVPPERKALEDRVAEMRRHLSNARDAQPGSTAPTLTAQAGRWNNWPNWSNWANWRNG